MKTNTFKKTNFIKTKKFVIIALLTLLASSSVPSYAFLGIFNKAYGYLKSKITEPVKKVESQYKDLKTKYDYAVGVAKTTAKVVKITTYSIAGLFFYKKFFKPISKLFLGKTIKPVLWGIDTGISALLWGGLLTGTVYAYRKFFAHKKTLKNKKNKTLTAK